MELAIERILQQGVAAHREGNLEGAERLYQTILQSQPLHPLANHNLGVIAVSVNKTDAAVPLFKTALEANPKIEQFWVSYIDALVEVNRLSDVKQATKQWAVELSTKDKPVESHFITLGFDAIKTSNFAH